MKKIHKRTTLTKKITFFTGRPRKNAPVPIKHTKSFSWTWSRGIPTKASWKNSIYEPVNNPKSHIQITFSVFFGLWSDPYMGFLQECPGTKYTKYFLFAYLVPEHFCGEIPIFFVFRVVERPFIGMFTMFLQPGPNLRKKITGIVCGNGYK